MLYQINWNRAHILSLHTSSTPRVGTKDQNNIYFLKVLCHVGYRINVEHYASTYIFCPYTHPRPRAFTRILKRGVPEPSLPKSGSPTIQKNIASFKNTKVNRSPSTKNGPSSKRLCRMRGIIGASLRLEHVTVAFHC